MEKTSVTIIGAGVVGLSIAAEISDIVKDMVVIEKHPCFGQETSSRNSEVIHAGIYYEKDSLKAQLCVRGNHLLYQICHRQQIPHQKIGKLIVAANDGEIKELEKLLARGRKNGVEELEMVSSDKIRQMEPNIKARAGLWSPFI
ncbi:MAG: FAD-dependent oxidoreductase [Candidatus Desantisbacteria bacterium]